MRFAMSNCFRISGGISRTARRNNGRLPTCDESYRCVLVEYEIVGVIHFIFSAFYLYRNVRDKLYASNERASGERCTFRISFYTLRFEKKTKIVQTFDVCVTTCKIYKIKVRERCGIFSTRPYIIQSMFLHFIIEHVIIIVLLSHMTSLHRVRNNRNG